MSIGGKQHAAPGPVTGPGTQPGTTLPGSSQPGSSQPGSGQPGSSQPGTTLAGLAAAAVRLLRLVGSRCCVGQADAAWRRTAARPPAGAGPGAEESGDAG